MIELNNVVKTFDGFRAVDDITLTIADKEVFGLIGTNGAGKSTLLRMMSGIFRPDSGSIRVDGEGVYDHPSVKKSIFFIPDEPYFFRNATAADMGSYYQEIYVSFDKTRFERLLSDFGLERKRKIQQYSKGMKKQLAVILGIASGTKFLLCDETFDGLDPVMRQAVKSIFASEILQRGLTPIIASHNLRELEDICDHVGLIHKGGALLSRDLNDMKLGLQKVQVVFRHEEGRQHFKEALKVLHETRIGSLCTFTVRAERAEVERLLASEECVFSEILPLTLEEIFICETEVVGYDIKKFILN